MVYKIYIIFKDLYYNVLNILIMIMYLCNFFNFLKSCLKYNLLIVFLLLQVVVSSQYLVSCNFLNSASASVLGPPTGLVLDYDVDMYKMTYNTVDTKGLPIIATGAFFIPINTTCKNFLRIWSEISKKSKMKIPHWP